MNQNPGHLTASDFYKYVKCPSWLYWDIFGDPKDKTPVSAMMTKLREGGVEHEKTVIDELGDFVEMEEKGDSEVLAAATIAAMKEGKIIYQGTLKDGEWVGRPDLLMPHKGKSNFGDFVYEAVDIKSAFRLNDVHKYQLTFYSLLLEKVQGTLPKKGKIINARKEFIEFDIQEVYSNFFEILASIEEIRAGKKPDLYLMSGAKESPWYELLKREVEEIDDLSRIYKLYRKEYKLLRKAGYDTVTGFAETSFDNVSQSVGGIATARLGRIHLQAIALTKGEAMRIGEPKFPDKGVELHFDIEGDPFLGVEYLFGLLIRENGKEEYKIFIAEDPKDEGKAWLEFCDFIEGYSGTPIYHYGWYELDVIKRLSARYGISTVAANALDKRNMIDLNRMIQNTVIFPLHFYSLKDICKYLGFKWRANDASGANSVLWFQEWLDKQDRKMLQKIIDYNEDDVRATAHLKDWLSKTSF